MNGQKPVKLTIEERLYGEYKAYKYIQECRTKGKTDTEIIECAYWDNEPMILLAMAYDLYHQIYLLKKAD